MKIGEWFDSLPIPELAKDIIFVVVVVGAISLLSQITLGLWTPMVAVESGSMVPNLNVGDIIIVQGASRTEVIPWDEGEKKNYTAFNNPGDVILYRPYGKESLNLFDQLKMVLGMPPSRDKAVPIIHRAMYFVEEGEPMWEGGPAAPFAGYITKGDHNEVIDQMAGQWGMANMSYFDQHRDGFIRVDDDVFLDKNTGFLLYQTENGTYVVDGISYLTPVKEEWVIGVARVRIPLVGYIRLLPNIISDEVHKVIGF